jgi:hypothetical protein
VATLAGLQSNVPGLAGYTRFHWPFCTWAMTMQGVAAWVAASRSAKSVTALAAVPPRQLLTRPQGRGSD